jgi:hypothetical protein
MGSDEKSMSHQTYYDTVLVKVYGYVDRAGKPDRFVPLNYQGQRSLFKSYMCNSQMGTHIRALGFRIRNPKDYTPFYLTFGEYSFHREYIQPYFVPTTALNGLAKDHKDPACMPIIDATIAVGSKINHVLDFSFASNRLILGMYCGILVIKDITTKYPKVFKGRRTPNLDEFEASEFEADTYVKFEDRFENRKLKFQPIHRIVSSTCCGGLCRELPQIAVGFSYKFKHTEENIKMIYISFDNGDTWSQKLMAPNEATLVQLFRGLYKSLPGELNEPEFLTTYVKQLKRRKKWPKGKNDDAVVRAILGKGTVEDKEAPLDKEGTICSQIVSIEVVPEELSLLALCRTNRGDPLNYPHPGSQEPEKVALNLHYAVFEFRISRYSPLLIPTQRSKRRMACTVRRMVFAGLPEYHEPNIIRTFNSFNLFIVGCDTILYHSVNGGEVHK